MPMRSEFPRESYLRSSWRTTSACGLKQPSPFPSILKRPLLEQVPVEQHEREKSIKKMHIRGNPYYSSKDAARIFFQGCGKIAVIDCMTFPVNWRSRGAAIVTFKIEDEGTFGMDCRRLEKRPKQDAAKLRSR